MSKGAALELFKIFWIIFGFLFLVQIINTASFFYEGGAYLAYFRSMYQDFDFNIINQLPEQMSWVVTKNFFHPDFHSEIQSPFLLPFYLLEKVSWFLALKPGSGELEFQLAGLLLNLFSIYAAMVFIKNAAEELKMKVSKSDFMIFYFGSVFFYFSFLQATVLEVTFFPLISYFLLLFFRAKNGNYPASPWLVGLFAGAMSISKITFWPISFLILSLYGWHFYKKGLVRRIGFLAGGYLLVVGSNFLNKIVKYGSYMDPERSMRHFLDFSPSNLLIKVTTGYFGQRGLFFVNPVYLVSLVGLVFLLKSLYQKKKINLYDLIVLSGWIYVSFFVFLFLLGDIIEDHIPGRHILSTTPLLILGLSYFRSTYLKKWRIVDFVLVGFCLWHFFLTASYFSLCRIDCYLFQNQYLPDAEQMSFLLQRLKINFSHNFDLLGQSIFQFFIFSAAASALFYWVRKYRPKELLLSWSFAAAVAAFSIMTLLNLFFHSKNVEKMKTAKVFAGKVVADGPEIFFMDYALDYARTLELRGIPDVTVKVKKVVDHYYDIVKNQVILSTPRFDQALAEKSADFSIWIEIEKRKRKL